MLTLSKKRFLNIVFWIVIANFIAQFPYYIHQYYLAIRLAPSFIGSFLLIAVLVWFLLGWNGLRRNKVWGYWTLLSFLLVEFLFYIQTQVVQAFSGKGILLHVLHYDGFVLFFVFLIGYINCIAAGYFIYYLLKYRARVIIKP